MKNAILSRLMKAPKDRNLILSLLVTSIPFLLITLFFVLNERGLESACGYGVLDFELAWTTNTVDKIFAAWGSVELQHQAVVTWVDYLYIAFYVSFGAECVLLVTRKSRGGIAQAGMLLVLAPVLAGIFDAVENIFLLSMLYRGDAVGAAIPLLASLCATFKIGLLGAGLSFFYIASLLLVGRRYQIPESYSYLALLVSGSLAIWLLSLWNLTVSLTGGAVYFFLVLLLAWLERNKKALNDARAEGI